VDNFVNKLWITLWIKTLDIPAGLWYILITVEIPKKKGRPRK